jgi:hypothetical protein
LARVFGPRAPGFGAVGAVEGEAQPPIEREHQVEPRVLYGRVVDRGGVRGRRLRERAASSSPLRPDEPRLPRVGDRRVPRVLLEARVRGLDERGVARVERRPVTTLAALCEKHRVERIDFLKVDVEGAEADVLAGNDWKRFRPKVVVCEAIAPLSNEPAWDEWEPYLLAQGYRFCLYDQLNRFYVAEEAEDVLARMPRERAPWESATHMYEIGRAPDNAKHPEHELARKLARGFWASLPELDPRLLAGLMARADGQRPSEADLQKSALALTSDENRARLGRIACGYDGGQLFDD